ncbi:cytochrome c [Ewingella americana]|uniref:Gluconate 2-dehydrogenase cytochrome c subunit n=2 Tax=Ewingella americana TaxID=41202 RepID=A0A377NJ65_9GAMM|nr:Gluconate 2-dehydrogenase cytochrome c subunit precursor [Ewingella americana]
MTRKITIKSYGLWLAMAINGLVQTAHADSDVAAQIKHGEYLARAGDCAACHTAPGGKPFAGGLKMMTPVGAIYASNITPDKLTGIGSYSEQDFSRALRQGIAQDGHHLYPAMPYPSFNKITDSDTRDLYLYFTQQVVPVAQTNRPSDIPFPLNIRWPLAVWNQVFLQQKPYYSDPKQTANWNRGAYLVQGLGHCGSCHTPRGVGFQEKALDNGNRAYLSGGTLDGWHAPNLRGDATTGLGQWTEGDITQFLQQGHTPRSTAFGSMVEVVQDSTQYLTDADRQAIAVYLKSLPADGQFRVQVNNSATAQALEKGDLAATGAQLYMDNCADCHLASGQGEKNKYPQLAQNPVVVSADPSSMINIVLRGAHSPVTVTSGKGAKMPAFADRLEDQEVADVVNFIRNGWGNQAERVSAAQVKAMRKLTEPDKG